MCARDDNLSHIPSTHWDIGFRGHLTGRSLLWFYCNPFGSCRNTDLSFQITPNFYSPYPTFWQFILFICTILLAIWCMCIWMGIDVLMYDVRFCVYMCTYERTQDYKLFEGRAMISTSSFFVSSLVSANLIFIFLNSVPILLTTFWVHKLYFPPSCLTNFFSGIT